MSLFVIKILERLIGMEYKRAKFRELIKTVGLEEKIIGRRF